MYNKKVLREATKNLNSTKAPAKKKDMIVDPMGQWKHPGENTRIPGNDITMQGVPYPVWAVPNVGIPQMMYPEQDYYFPGADHVDEYPQMKTGGVLNKAQTGKIIKCPEGYTYDQKTKKCVSNYERSEYAYPEGTQIRDIHEIHDIWPSNLGRDFVHINEPIYVKPIEQKELVYTKGQHPQTINIYPDINYKLSVDPSKPEGYDKNTNTYYVPSENTHQYRKYKEWEKAKELEKQNLQIADELIKTGQFNYEVNPDQTKSLIKKAGNYTDPNYLPEGLKSYDETYKQTAKDRYNQYLKTNCPECSFGHGESVYYDNDYVYRKENPTLGGYESIDKKIKPILKRTRESIDPTIEDSKKPEINYRYGVWGATGATPQGGGKTEATSLPEGTWNNSQQNYKRKNTLNTLDLGNTSFAQGGLVLHDSLRTWDLGDYEGLPETTETKKLIKKHENNPDLPIPGGETYNEFKQRITPGFEKLLKDAPDKSLIVTHSHVIKTLGLPKTKHGEYHTIKKHGKTIYIAPHGDTPQNKSVKETPDQIRTKDVDLAPKGVNEVENLSKKLANKNISAIYASPLPRTIETATIIKNSLGNKFQVGGDISIPELNQYEDGGEYDLTQEEIDDLIAQGYIVEDADEYKKGGTPRALPKKKSSKGYSRSLTATNKLFAESPLTKKSKSKKNKIFDPNAKYYQDGGPYSKTINTFTNPVVNETDENTGYNAATGEINQDTRPGSIENNNWWTEHEKFHHLQNLAGGMSSAGILGQRPNNTVASDQAMGNYYNRRDNELEAQTNAMIKADPNLQFIPRNKLAEGAGPGFIGANDLMYSDPSTLEGEARNYENYIRQGGKSIFPQKQEGGAQLPKDYSQFTNFHQTLPSNLQDPEYQYGNPDQYDLYGMWNTLGKPGSFKDVQDSDYFPLQDDGTYHGFSVGSDGTVLKPMSHSTTWKEVMNSQLNTDPYFKENRLIKNEQGRLQYVPNKQEGGISPLEGNYISKVIMNRNRGTDFVDRAYALGDNPGTPMFNLPDNEQFGQNMSHKMAWGDDDNGQAWMYPTIMNPNDEAIQVPTQYANYISSEGYKYATGMKQKGGAQDRFNTKLKGNVLESFNEHAKQFPSLLNDTYDYDSRGLYNELYDIHKGDKEAIANALTPGSPTAHVGTDRYKKPNHPTFSKESKYYIPVIRNAGTWGHNDQGDYFKASRRNIRNMTNSDGSPYQYFQRAEDYDLDSIPDVGLEYRGKKLFEKGGFQDDLGKHRQLLRDWTYGQSIGMLQKAQEGLDTGVVESKTPWANAPEGMSPNVYEGKDITVKAKGPEWAHFQREYQNANPWERYLAGEKNKYIRKHKGLNKTAGVTADNFPKDAEERIRQEYDRKMNTYTTRRLGQHFGFNPRQRGEWIDRLTDKQKEIVAGSKYGSKLQPNVWSRFLSGARSTVNLLHPTEFKIQGQIPGYTEAENKEALNSWLEPLEILAPLDAPGMIVANKMTNMNAENPSWYSGEMMGNVDYGAVVAMNPLTLLDLYGLPEAPLRISRGLKKGAKFLTTQTPLKDAYVLNPKAIKADALFNKGVYTRTDTPHWWSGYEIPYHSGLVPDEVLQNMQSDELFSKLSGKDWQYQDFLRKNKGMSYEEARKILNPIEERLITQEQAVKNKGYWEPGKTSGTEYFDRINYLKQLQKEGLIGKGFNAGDMRWAARNEDVTNSVAKKALENFNTGYRNVNTNAEVITKLPEEEIINMKNAGVDFADENSIGEYMASHPPLQDYYLRQGWPTHSGEWKPLYSHKNPSSDFGDRMYKVGLNTDFSEGNYADWYTNNYLNKIKHPEVSKAIEPAVFNRMAGQGEYRVFMGPKGKQALVPDKSYQYHGVNIKDLSPAERESFEQFSKQALENYNTGWKNELMKPNADLSLPNKTIDFEPSGEYVRSGLGGMDMSRYEIKNPDYFTQLLDTYTSKQLSPSNKKFYNGLIESVKKQDGLATERQYNELQRLKTGNFNFGSKGYNKGYQEGGITEEAEYTDVDLTPEEIDWYLANGYDLEDLGDSETFDDYLPEAQTGFVIEGKTNAVPQKKKTAAPIPPPVVTEDIVVSKTPTEKLVIQGKTNAVPKTETRKRVQPPVENAEGYFAKSPYAYQSLSGYMAKNPIVPEQVGLTPYAASLIEGRPHTTISGIQKPAKKSKPLTAKEQSALEAQIKYKLYGSDDDSEVYGSDLFPGMDELIDTKTQQLKRFLEKKGVVDTKDYKLDPKKTQSKKAPVVAATPKAAKFYQELGTVPDSYDPKHNLLSYRNQWDNKEGFEYIATPVKKDRSGNEEYKNVKGVGHFLLDASVANGKVYKWKDNDAYINQAKKNNEWIPAFTRVNGDRVKLQYKKADELTKKDIVVSPLRQMSYDEIKFDQTQRPEGFQSGIKEVKKSDGQGTYLLFKDRNGYSRFSGGSVVFIFKDKYGNTIVRDYAGSLNGIENEGINIKKEYNLKPGQLTIGYHDVGSFSAKPKADSTGTLRSSQWEGFNNNGVTGGALLIPNK